LGLGGGFGFGCGLGFFFFGVVFGLGGVVRGGVGVFWGGGVVVFLCFGGFSPLRSEGKGKGNRPNRVLGVGGPLYAKKKRFRNRQRSISASKKVVKGHGGLRSL